MPSIQDAVQHPDITPRGQVPDEDNHRWIAINDDDGDIWMFDVTYLLSNYHCIYGKGCPGIDTEPDHSETVGCCVHGAHFVDDDDMNETFRFVQRLTDADWQFKSVAEANHRKTKGGEPRKPAHHGGFAKLDTGEWTTRVHKNACIFLNRADHPGGAGCALHSAAMKVGERPMDWKPDVCWQVPVRMDVHTDDNERDTVFIRAWERHDWGEGGKEFHWWCNEEPEAYTAEEPVYITSKDELIGFVGEDIYNALAGQLDAIRNQTVTPVTIGKPIS